MSHYDSDFSRMFVTLFLLYLLVTERLDSVRDFTRFNTALNDPTFSRVPKRTSTRCNSQKYILI